MLYNWVLDFLYGRTIEVRVNAEQNGRMENGTLQGSVCSPVLLNMINDIFEQDEEGIGKLLYADDKGAESKIYAEEATGCS